DRRSTPLPYTTLFRSAERQAFLAHLGTLDRDQWLVAVRADQQRRWALGQLVMLESYLDLRPAMLEDTEAVLDLIHQELFLRESRPEEHTSELQSRGHL